MGEWKLAADGCAAQCGYHVIVSAEEERSLRVSLMCSCSYAVARDIPFPILASVMAATDEGRKAMARALVEAGFVTAGPAGVAATVAALRDLGWTCCPPGSEVRTIREIPEAALELPSHLQDDYGQDVRYVRVDPKGA